MHLIEALSDICSTTPPHIIAIDGRAGAGKSRLAGELHRTLGRSHTVAVIALDDLYDGWDSALDESLTNNLQKIVSAHQLRKPININIYDWNSATFNTTRTINSVDVLIIEGVGSGQSVVRESGATTIWVEIQANEGLARVLERDGDSISPQMQKWLVQQEEHFNQSQVRENADFILTAG